MTSARATLSFRNNYNTEKSGVSCDGYMLEVSAPNISGGDFLDITNLQGWRELCRWRLHPCSSIVRNSPIAGRMAWASNSNGYIDTVINLGPNLVGQTVTFRFRMVTDEAVAAPGVHIDNLVFTGASCP